MESINVQPKKVRAALYLRCSTDEQTQGYGLAVQEDKMKAYCLSQADEYVVDPSTIYRDEGYSGSLDIEQRPALKKLFEDAKDKKFDLDETKKFMESLNPAAAIEEVPL